MIVRVDPPPPDSLAREIAKAVFIAALSVFATKLVEWGVDELRERVSPKKKEAEKGT